MAIRKPKDTLTLALVQALNGAWLAIRKNHPEVPEAAIILGSGSDGRATLKFGHWARSRWERKGDDVVSELFVGGEGLKRGAVSTMGTLLHEAGHALAQVRGIDDTSRGGRYHNQKFKALANELGVDIEKDPRIGYSITTVPKGTEQKYKTEIAALKKAITATRRHEMVRAAGSRTNNNNGLSTECECDPPRKIRVSDSVYDQGPISCGLCGADFEQR